MNALVYVDIDQGIHKGKMKVALNEKRKKLHGFSFSINIANFKAFLSVFKLTKNLFFSEECQGVVIFIKKVYKYVPSMLQIRMCSTHKNKQFDTVEIPL